ncbi:MAG: phosphate ABC transporter permease PstA [Nitrospirota bacterium]|nr:phosphate ABC transporter permease PstA [Nitrospirota bacterium]MDE3241343.1 phosphate ABC transporter permease PstA [Nitrospirota bacterium]
MTRAPLKAFWKSGELFVWLTASGVALSLLMIGALLGLIMVKGLGQFWPADILEIRLADGRTLIGQPINSETIPHSTSQAHPDGKRRTRFRVGNQDAFGYDFKWVDADAVVAQAKPFDLTVFNRREWGPLYGRVRALYREAAPVAEGPAAWPALLPLIEQANRLHERIHRIEHDEIGEINRRLESLRLQRQALRLDNRLTDDETTTDLGLQQTMAGLEEEYQRQAATLDSLRRQAGAYEVAVSLSTGQEVRLPLSKVITALRPNEMDWSLKTLTYLGNLWEFLSGEPREANTEGGIFPTIFGTVMMVLIMTVAVMPFGVMAALYLREYARQGPLVQLVRIAVNNLAGVPSIVFGVFGLGFFVYTVGGTVDALFFPEALPNPTYGTGGILWASLTLALLTVPVVIVATEEGLSSVPRDFREGSIALGATKLETIRHVVLPCALPGILTGLILAMARAAGEVAPLMLTGVVKLAPDLPVDGQFPFLHLDRKFMHLGFHIYDVGFQSPNVEAAKPMVYMTTLTLIAVVVLLNLVAVMIRNHLRKRYAASAV